MTKILAIDDQQDNLLVLKTILHDLMPEVTVITALTGLEGIETAEAESPDVILLDVIMPGMNGFEVCQRLKSNEKCQHIPIIMITAIYKDAASRVKGLELGADAFLSKPIDETELVAQVKVMLRIKKAENALRKQRNELQETVQETKNELHLSQERLRLLLDQTDEGVWSWDTTTGDILFDDNWLQILGHKPEEKTFDNKWWQSNIHPDSKPVFRKALKDYLKGKEKYYELEYQVRHTAGHWMWVGSRGICVEYDDKGHPLKMLGTHREITKQKHAEESIKRSLKEKETLLQEIHHRVKNNMAVIASLLRLQAHSIDDDRIKEALKESQGRVYAMSIVHETLHGSENLSEIDLKTVTTQDLFWPFLTNFMC
ncbi:response regulator [bacterium]|nr:response regulator [bacterium]